VSQRLEQDEINACCINSASHWSCLYYTL